MASLCGIALTVCIMFLARGWTWPRRLITGSVEQSQGRSWESGRRGFIGRSRLDISDLLKMRKMLNHRINDSDASFTRNRNPRKERFDFRKLMSLEVRVGS